MRNIVTLLITLILAPTLSVAGKQNESEKVYEGLLFPDQERTESGNVESQSRKVGLAKRNRLSVEGASLLSAAELGAMLQRPESPLIDVVPERIAGFANISEANKIAVRACSLESRLAIHDPFSRRLRAYFRDRDNNHQIKGALIYDDGSASQSMCTEAFDAFFRYMKLPKRNAKFGLITPYQTELGNHATAVTATLLQACPASSYPIVVVGGDGKKGDFSDGTGIDASWARNLMNDLQNAERRGSILRNPVVLNASYGTDGAGHKSDALDEGGLWGQFWRAVPDSVVVQAAGNSAKNLTATDKQFELDRAEETAFNMLHTQYKPELQGRLIQAIASVADHRSPENTELLATSFSNFYRVIDSSFCYFARDNSMMAPGAYVFIPLDPFDKDQDGRHVEAANQLNEWSGTSAAAPLITGSILRLVNEFGITAKQAGALLLETADSVVVPVAGGRLKSLNLGEAMVEALKLQLINEISRTADKYKKFSEILGTYFSDRSVALSVKEKNFLFDIADRCGEIRIRPYDLASVRAIESLVNWKKLRVKSTNFKMEELYFKKGENGELITYIFTDPSKIYVKTIQPEATENPRIVDFRLTYTNSTKAPDILGFTCKGIIDGEIKHIMEVDGTDGHQWIASVEIPAKFESARTLILDMDKTMILGKNDNRAHFDGKKFVVG